MDDDQPNPPSPDPGDLPNDTSKRDALFVSPVRGGVASLVLLACGIFLAGLPFYLIGTSPVLNFSAPEIVIGLFFVALGAMIVWPGVVIARSIVLAQPLIWSVGGTVNKRPMGFSETRLTWTDVGSVSLRGLWVILLDGRIKQSRFTQIMFGAKGIWIPALLMHGGGAATMQFIERARPDLIEPLIHRVVSGRR